MKNSEINTLLYASIYSSIVKKNIEYVKTLIDAGAKIDFSDENGVTAWFIAANSKLGGGDFELLEILLKNGTNINALNKNNNTVLDEAIIYNKDGRVAEFLLKNGAIIDFKKDGKKPLLVQATSDDNFEIVKLLLAYGANPNSRSDDGKTALISAAFNKNLRIIKELVKSGAEINIVDNGGHSPLSWAHDDLETLEYLLQNGADPDIDISPKKLHIIDNLNLGKSGSVLNKACSKNNLDKALLLLKYGANPNNQDYFMKASPLHWACHHGNFMLVKELIERGANTKLKDVTGHTPAMKALETGHKDIFDYLLLK
jgi:ankyrin repeat protein